MTYCDIKQLDKDITEETQALFGWFLKKLPKAAQNKYNSIVQPFLGKIDIEQSIKQLFYEKPKKQSKAWKVWTFIKESVWQFDYVERQQDAVEFDIDRIKSWLSIWDNTSLEHLRWARSNPKYIVDIESSLRNTRKYLQVNSKRSEFDPAVQKMFIQASEKVKDVLSSSKEPMALEKFFTWNDIFASYEQLSPDLARYIQTNEFWNVKVNELTGILEHLWWKSLEELAWAWWAVQRGVYRGIKWISKAAKVFGPILSHYQFIPQAIQSKTQYATFSRLLFDSDQDVSEMLELMINEGYIRNNTAFLELDEFTTTGLNKDTYQKWVQAWRQIGSVIRSYKNNLLNSKFQPNVSNTWDIAEAVFDPEVKKLAFQAAAEKFWWVKAFLTQYRQADTLWKADLLQKIADRAENVFMPTLRWFSAAKFAQEAQNESIAATANRLRMYMGWWWLAVMKAHARNFATPFVWAVSWFRNGWVKEALSQFTDWLWALEFQAAMAMLLNWLLREQRINRIQWRPDKNYIDRLSNLANFSLLSAWVMANSYWRVVVETIDWYLDAWTKFALYKWINQSIREFGRQIRLLPAVSRLVTWLVWAAATTDGKGRDYFTEAISQTFFANVNTIKRNIAIDDEWTLWDALFSEKNWEFNEALNLESQQAIMRTNAREKADYNNVLLNAETKWIYYPFLLWKNSPITKAFKTITSNAKDYASILPFAQKVDEKVDKLNSDTVIRWFYAWDNVLPSAIQKRQQLYRNTKDEKKFEDAVFKVVFNTAAVEGEWSIINDEITDLYKATLAKSMWWWDVYAKFLEVAGSQTDKLMKAHWEAIGLLKNWGPWTSYALLTYMANQLVDSATKWDIVYVPANWYIATVNWIKEVKKWDFISESEFGLSAKQLKKKHEIGLNPDWTMYIDVIDKSESSSELYRRNVKLAIAEKLLPLVQAANNPAYMTVVNKYQEGVVWITPTPWEEAYVQKRLEMFWRLSKWELPKTWELSELSLMASKIYINDGVKPKNEKEKRDRDALTARFKLAFMWDELSTVRWMPISEDAKAVVMTEMFKNNYDALLEYTNNPWKYPELREFGDRALWELFASSNYINDWAKEYIIKTVQDDSLPKSWWTSGRASWKKIWGKYDPIDIFKDTLDMKKFVTRNYELLSTAWTLNGGKEKTLTRAETNRTNYYRGVIKWATAAISVDQYTSSRKWSGNIRSISIPKWKRADGGNKTKGVWKNKWQNRLRLY